jgi:hypothetical protein
VGLAGNSRKYLIWDVDRDRPMGQWSYKTAFESARQKCRITCRFYDASHTFVTRLAENPTVSVETIRQLAGRAGDRMLGRYAHIRVQARREAIATLERRQKSEKFLAIGRRRTQNWAQSPDIIKTSGRVVMKTLSLPENKKVYRWSGWPDLNRRPHAPQACALPVCATPRRKPPQYIFALGKTTPACA